MQVAKPNKRNVSKLAQPHVGRNLELHGVERQTLPSEESGVNCCFTERHSGFGGFPLRITNHQRYLGSPDTAILVSWGIPPYQRQTSNWKSSKQLFKNITIPCNELHALCHCWTVRCGRDLKKSQAGNFPNVSFIPPYVRTYTPGIGLP